MRSSALLTVHNLNGNKWNLLPWNLAALCQRCHHRVQWTLDFYQSTLTDVYPQWMRAHVRAYNAWAQAKGRTRFVLAECNNGNRSAILSRGPFASTNIAKLASSHEVERSNEMVPRPWI